MSRYLALHDIQIRVQKKKTKVTERQIKRAILVCGAILNEIYSNWLLGTAKNLPQASKLQREDVEFLDVSTDIIFEWKPLTSYKEVIIKRVVLISHYFCIHEIKLTPSFVNFKNLTTHKKSDDMSKVMLVEGKVEDGKFVRLLYGDSFLHVETYSKYYSASWTSKIKPSELITILDKLKIPESTQCVMYTKSKPQNAEYKFSEVKATKYLDEECLFLRVNFPEYNITWHFEERLKTNIVGFISEKSNLEVLQHIFECTSKAPLPLEKASLLKDIAGRYAISEEK
jgi:hypothetical protein